MPCLRGLSGKSCCPPGAQSSVPRAFHSCVTVPLGYALRLPPATRVVAVPAEHLRGKRLTWRASPLRSWHPAPSTKPSLCSDRRIMKTGAVVQHEFSSFCITLFSATVGRGRLFDAATFSTVSEPVSRAPSLHIRRGGDIQKIRIEPCQRRRIHNLKFCTLRITAGFPPKTLRKL